MRSSLVLLLMMSMLLGHWVDADATLVKCRGDGGSVVYQDQACKPGTELRNFDTDPATLSVVPGLRGTAPAVVMATQDRRSARAGRRQPEQKIASGKAAERRFIRTGMSEAEVVRRIGRPEVSAGAGRKPGKDGKHWSYLPAAGDPDTITTVTIAGGSVTSVERKVVR